MLQFVDLRFNVKKLNALKAAVDKAGNAVENSQAEQIFIKKEKYWRAWHPEKSPS